MNDKITRKNVLPSERLTDDSLDTLLGEVAGEFFDRMTNGECPQVEDYVARYPEIAGQILATFPALQIVGDSRAESNGKRTDTDVAGQKKLGDFRILGELGRGGMGVVYEAEQLSLGRRVALKVLPFAAMAQDKALERFRNEVRAAAALDHPNIVSVYSVGEERGVHYYAMQLIRGKSLADVIAELSKLSRGNEAITGESISRIVSSVTSQQRSFDATIASGSQEAVVTVTCREIDTVKSDLNTGTLSQSTGMNFFRSAALLGIQAAEALQHAHDQGVLHRDIKPGNLMLDSEAQLYITDFGLARIEADVGMTMTGDILGTLRYMSPEQALANRVVIDHRTDLYALSVTLYELLSLQPVFSSPDRQQLLQQIAFEEPKKLRQIDRSIPGELETIIHKGFEKNPDDRYATAQDFADDLRAFLNDRPIKAKRATITQRTGKLVRRHQAVVATAAIGLFAMLAIGAGLMWRSWHRETDLRVAAENSAVDAIQSEARATKLAEAMTAAAEREKHLREQSETSERRAKWNLYVARLYPMGQALKEGDYGLLTQLLEETIPADGEPDYRGWEWYFLEDQNRAASSALSNPKSTPADSIRWCSTSNRFATNSSTYWGRRLRIWDGATLQPIHQITLPSVILEFEFSPSGDRIAAGTQDGKLHIVNLDSFTIVQTITPFSPNLDDPKNTKVNAMLRGLTWSPDGHSVAVGNWFGQIATIELQTGELQFLRQPQSQSFCDSLDWHPFKPLIAAGLQYGERRIYNISTGSSIALEKTNDSVGVEARWNPSGTILALAEKNRVRTVDEQGRTLFQRDAHDGNVNAIRWIDDERFASCSDDHTIHICAVDQTQPLAVVNIHGAGVTSIAVDAAHERLFSCDSSMDLRVSSIQKHHSYQIARIEGGTAREESRWGKDQANALNMVHRIEWSPDGTMLAAVGGIYVGNGKYSGAGSVWNAATLNRLSGWETGLCKGLSWSRDGDRIMVPSHSKQLIVVDPRTASQVQTRPLDLLDESIALWSPDNRLIAANASGPHFCIRNARTLEPITQWILANPKPFVHGKWNHTGNRLLESGWGGTFLRDVEGNSKKVGDGIRAAMAWHSTDSCFALGDQNGQITIFRADNSELVATLHGNRGPVTGLDFSPNGRRLASASFDGTVKIWDFASGTELLQFSAEGIHDFTDVAWSPDGLQLAVGTGSREVVVWGTSQVRPTPMTATFDETGTMIGAVDSAVDTKVDCFKAVPALPWRVPLNDLQQAAHGPGVKVDRARFEHFLSQWTDGTTSPDNGQTDLILAWRVFIDAQVDDESAIYLADRLIDHLGTSTNELPSSKLLLETRVHASLAKAGRQLKLNWPAESLSTMDTAERDTEALVTQFPQDATCWRLLQSVHLQKFNVAVQAYETLVTSTEADATTLKQWLDRVEQLFDHAENLQARFPNQAQILEPDESQAAMEPPWTTEALTRLCKVQLQNQQTLVFLDRLMLRLAGRLDQTGTSWIRDSYLANCQLMKADDDEYRANCLRMLEKYCGEGNKYSELASDSEFEMLTWVAFTCALAPNAVDDYETALQVARRIESHALAKENAASFRGYLSYRSGDYDVAFEILSPLMEPSGEAEASWRDMLFLSMTECRRGNLNQAKHWFEMASSRIDDLLANGKAGTDKFRWDSVASARILRKEAADLLFDEP
ncbi:WD40 repeat domain-containing serine/threonine protein kinase [Stieleria varia]|uniref:Serine/threonine-protein kinase PrkC n=1 Tax=Stieleria varia TaxID=2528005 RepID=A0A5C5ZWI0_9BACT|nr:WD40 repeat domain-containing serine/threonine protein kinase [Stieleria varia]TWT91972.1 Serine/threonine-protein kinase PrkC [Stieleria varia]